MHGMVISYMETRRVGNPRESPRSERGDLGSGQAPRDAFCIVTKCGTDRGSIRCD